MACKTWFELARKYRLSVQAYSDAVDRLDAESRAGFEEAWQRIDRARVRSEESRRALLNHASDHACVPPGEFLDELTDLVLGDQGQSGG